MSGFLNHNLNEKVHKHIVHWIVVFQLGTQVNILRFLQTFFITDCRQKAIVKNLFGFDTLTYLSNTIF